MSPRPTAAAGAELAKGEEPPARRPRILVVGNANVDVLLGDVAPWPRTGTELMVDRYELRVGGAAGNTGLALAALGVKGGEASEVIASVGSDALGGWLEDELKGAARLTRVPGSTALTVGLTHPDGQRTFVSHLGHLAQLPLERLDTALQGARPGDLLLLCGYFLLPQLREMAPRLLQAARARGIVTTLDTGWPTEGWTEAVRDELLGLLPHLDVFLPNREELLGVAGLADGGGYDPAAVDEALARLHERGAGQVVVKLGPSGALFADEDERHLQPAPDVEVQDTVGAGDTFNAALLAAVQRGMSWPRALAPAVRAASLAIASAPRRYPSWDEVAGG